MRLSVKPSHTYAEYLRRLTCDEWEEIGMSGKDKVILRHRATGTTVTYGTHDGGNDINSARNFAAEVAKTCGCKLIEPRGRKRSRKADDHTDFEIARAKRETDGWHRTLDGRIYELRTEREWLIENCRAIVVVEPTDESMARLADYLRRIVGIEDELIDSYNEPIEPFNPLVLAPGGAA